MFYRASGHVDRFSDLMVKDVKTGECFRADQLLADHLEQLLADQKCPADKKEEYNTVLRQVMSGIIHTYFLLYDHFVSQHACVIMHAYHRQQKEHWGYFPPQNYGLPIGISFSQ